jgi:small-conductance mechanosensitive channel
VGLRSVKIRTLDRTVVTVPNADFAKMQLENLSERDRVLLREEICLRYETTREQLQLILSELEAMLQNHPQIADEGLRVRFTGFGRYYIEIELFAYAMTSAWSEFLSIRQNVLVNVMEIIGRSGTRLALPTEVHYSARDVEELDAHGTAPESPA